MIHQNKVFLDDMFVCGDEKQEILCPYIQDIVKVNTIL